MTERVFKQGPRFCSSRMFSGDMALAFNGGFVKLEIDQLTALIVRGMPEIRPGRNYVIEMSVREEWWEEADAPPSIPPGPVTHWEGCHEDPAHWRCKEVECRHADPTGDGKCPLCGEHISLWDVK